LIAFTSFIRMLGICSQLNVQNAYNFQLFAEVIVACGPHLISLSLGAFHIAGDLFHSLDNLMAAALVNVYTWSSS